ncbi:MarR family winged helix-turn-helix transcriptional regulator [Nocardioides sp. CER19]|uniref:MarR family winged helix-turn-helix transcriptional regulator n=1 Tax=Nocardioides sp. CER19 TaxID=3038538 RepID=UPI002447ABE3|nr:MarR family winged helix-turn-helix transcriptional regulator [Nocardioides sp. CER19]MDH2416020.1 MarR family winged helix-turn-helix transcriptional regulator [Nocardioides sp. CER19]
MTDDPELVDAFIRASRALVGVAVRSIAAAPVALTAPQHRALVLVASGRADSVSMLQEHLGINQSNVSRLVVRLERLGLVERRRSSADARTVVISVTPLGRDALDAVNRRRRAEISGVLAAMDARDRVDAVRVMRAFDAAARETDDGGWPVDGA